MYYGHKTESNFRPTARTQRKYVFGLIPSGRISSAYGYSQALDGTWKEYKKSTVAWSHQTVSGTLSLADCSILQLTRIQNPENISISGSNDLSVAFDVEFNRAINTPATSDFEAINFLTKMLLLKCSN